MQTTVSTATKQTSVPNYLASLEVAISAIFFFALWGFWALRYADYLYAVQENSFFVFRYDFFQRWTSVPEGGLCYVTAFLMQFFYYPVLGGAILALLGSILQLSLARLTRLRGAAYVATFLPSCFLVVASTWPGYFIFAPYNAPLIFSGFLGLLFAVLGTLAYDKISSFKVRLLFFLLITQTYVLVGAWSVVCGLFCAINEGTRRVDKQGARLRSRLTRVLILATISVVFPLLLQRFWLFPKLKTYNVFFCGLIEDVRYERDSLTSLFTYGFILTAPICAQVTYLLARAFDLRKDESSLTRAQSKMKKRALKRLEKRRAVASKAESTNAFDENAILRAEYRSRAARTLELAFLLGVATFFLSYHNRAYFDGLKELRALTHADWERILEIDSKNANPSDLMVGLRNLALFETGRLTREAFTRPLGYYETRTLSLVDEAKGLAGNPYYKFQTQLWKWKSSTETISRRALCELVFCHYGLPNIAARAATDNLVATEDRSISFLKTLAVAAIINGEKELALRYLREVRENLFYGDWAKTRLAFLETSEFYKGAPIALSDPQRAKYEEERRANLDFLSINDAALKYGANPDDVQEVAKLVANARDLLPSSDYPATRVYPNLTYLIRLYNLDEYDKSSPRKKELILISALMQKNGEFYLAHVDDYLASNGFTTGGAPRAIEEGLAAWSYAQRDDKWNDIEYKFTPSLVEKMNLFIEFTRLYGASGAEQQEILRQTFPQDYCGFAIDDSVYGNQQ